MMNRKRMSAKAGRRKHMTQNKNPNSTDYSEMTACQLKNEEPRPEIDKIFKNPQFVCGNCGSKTHSAANLCNPEPL
jgi:predicted SprT family Zn-dependent metalloprotease